MRDESRLIGLKLENPFPLARHEDGTVLLKHFCGAFSLIAYQTAPTQEEIDAVARGLIKLSLVLLPVSPQLFLNVGLETGNSLQGSFNIKSCSDAHQKVIFAQGTPRYIRIFFVDTTSNCLRAMRIVPFDKEFATSFDLALKGQALASYGSESDNGAVEYTPAKGYETVKAHLETAPLEEPVTACDVRIDTVDEDVMEEETVKNIIEADSVEEDTVTLGN
jgi:hypothetical protein